MKNPDQEENRKRVKENKIPAFRKLVRKLARILYRTGRRW